MTSTAAAAVRRRRGARRAGRRAAVSKEHDDSARWPTGPAAPAGRWPGSQRRARGHAQHGSSPQVHDDVDPTPRAGPARAPASSRARHRRARRGERAATGGRPVSGRDRGVPVGGSGNRPLARTVAAAVRRQSGSPSPLARPRRRRRRRRRRAACGRGRRRRRRPPAGDVPCTSASAAPRRLEQVLDLPGVLRHGVGDEREGRRVLHTGLRPTALRMTPFALSSAAAVSAARRRRRRRCRRRSPRAGRRHPGVGDRHHAEPRVLDLRSSVSATISRIRSAILRARASSAIAPPRRVRRPSRSRPPRRQQLDLRAAGDEPLARVEHLAAVRRVRRPTTATPTTPAGAGRGARPPRPPPRTGAAAPPRSAARRIASPSASARRPRAARSAASHRGGRPTTELERVSQPSCAAGQHARGFSRISKVSMTSSTLMSL